MGAFCSREKSFPPPPHAPRFDFLSSPSPPSFLNRTRGHTTTPNRPPSPFPWFVFAPPDDSSPFLTITPSYHPLYLTQFRLKNNDCPQKHDDPPRCPPPKPPQKMDYLFRKSKDKNHRIILFQKNCNIGEELNQADLFTSVIENVTSHDSDWDNVALTATFVSDIQNKTDMFRINSTDFSMATVEVCVRVELQVENEAEDYNVTVTTHKVDSAVHIDLQTAQFAISAKAKNPNALEVITVTEEDATLKYNGTDNATICHEDYICVYSYYTVDNGGDNIGSPTFDLKAMNDEGCTENDMDDSVAMINRTWFDRSQGRWNVTVIYARVQPGNDPIVTRGCLLAELEGGRRRRGRGRELREDGGEVLRGGGGFEYSSPEDPSSPWSPDRKWDSILPPPPPRPWTIPVTASLTRRPPLAMASSVIAVNPVDWTITVPEDSPPRPSQE